MTQALIILILLGVPFGLAAVLEKQRMRGYWARACTGRQWRRQFPDHSKIEIREFLQVFVDAFGFADERRLNFSPADRVMDVYRALYPNPQGTDAMEIESLMNALEKRYGVEIANLWNENITLAEVFRLTRQTGK